MITATYINESQFSVQEDHYEELRIGTMLICIQGTDGILYTAVNASVYDAGLDRTVVTVLHPSLTSNLSQIGRGLVFVDPVNQVGTLPVHAHSAFWDGGYEAFSLFTDEDIVARLNSLGSLSDQVKNYVFGVNADGTDVEKKEFVGTDNQVIITHAPNKITLSGPQNLHPGATPTFAGLKLSGLTDAVVMADSDGDLQEVPDASNGKAAIIKSDGEISFGDFKLANLDDVSWGTPSHGDGLMWDAVLGKAKFGASSSSGGTDVGTVLGLISVFSGGASKGSSSAGPHASNHIDGGSDPVDGDKLEIDFSPANYASTIVAGTTDSTGQLTSHLRGLELALAAPRPWDYTPKSFQKKTSTTITIPADDYYALGYLHRGRYEKASVTKFSVASGLDIVVADHMVDSALVNDSWYSVFLTGNSDCLILPLVRAYSVDLYLGTTRIYLSKQDDHTQYELGFLTTDLAWNNYRLVKISSDTHDGADYIITDSQDDASGDYVRLPYDVTSQIAAGDWFMLVPHSTVSCVYLGMIRIDGTGNVVALRKQGWTYSYTGEHTAVGAVLDATTPDNTLVSSLVPPQAKDAAISINIGSGATPVKELGAYLYYGNSDENVLGGPLLSTGTLDVKTFETEMLWRFTYPAVIRNCFSQYTTTDEPATSGEFNVYAFSE